MPITRHARAALTAAIAALAALAPAPAALASGAQFGINVDIESLGFPNNRPADTYGAASGQDGFWNLVGPAAAPFSLLGLDGATTGVTMQQTAGGNNTRIQCVGGFVTQDWSALMCDYQWNVAGVVNFIEYEINNLPAGTYDMYTYAAGTGESFQPGFAVGVFTGADYTGASFISGAVLSQQFIVGRTHDLRTITVDAGETVTLQVFDTSGEFGDPVYLNGLQLVRQSGLSAVIDDPDPFECVCNTVQITGTANGASFSSYTLEYSASGGDPWTEIASSSTPVTNGVLAAWDASMITEGFYILRLTVQTAQGYAETSSRVVFFNGQFNPIDLRSPEDGNIYGGTVCFDGTVHDECFTRYQINRLTDTGPVPVDPANPNYFSPVINDPLGAWDSTTVPDGVHAVEVVGYNTCGDTDRVVREIIIDNTLPVVEFRTPLPCTSACDEITVTGTILDENLESWVLQYSGGGASNWTTIATGTNQVDNGFIASWDVSSLQDCCYALRLIAVDKADVNCGSARNRTEAVTTLYVGNPLDFDGDGVIGSADLGALLAGWGPACP